MKRLLFSTLTLTLALSSHMYGMEQIPNQTPQQASIIPVCSICSSDSTLNEPAIINCPDGHIFHESCIRQTNMRPRSTGSTELPLTPCPICHKKLKKLSFILNRINDHNEIENVEVSWTELCHIIGKYSETHDIRSCIRE
ncbi:MAG: hypothetical protein UU47_C0028G0008 [candidate division TM6 bacterium GW2011_GWE2_41_16]|nr:MAG: hypothetical protein UU47_C0028G0008 [candidate division TM6 bacterium GW2011_GWE2_41_16]